MAKYKISIQKIETKMVHKETRWAGEGTKNLVDRGDGTYEWDEEEEVSDTVYSQTVESENFDIKKVIESINQ